jgi:methionine sulfoxide reductase heme-binding subunit
MQMLRNSRYGLWIVLALPALIMAYDFLLGDAIAMDVVAPSGAWSARLIIAAMAIAPMIRLFGPHPILRWLARARRNIGVAAFLYTLLHLGFYAADMGTLAAMLDEVPLPGIWTAWAAFAFLLPAALTSNRLSDRLLRRSWKSVQRTVYPAALFTLLHWVWVHNDLANALIHFVPLLILLLARFAKDFIQPPNHQGVRL